MYKLYMNLNDGSNHVFYQNSEIPHLWLLASSGARTVAASDFYDNLIEIASKLDDELFTNEVVALVAELQMKKPSVIEISGPNGDFNKEALVALVQNYDYEKIFGTKVDRLEYYATGDSKQYFKEYQKDYRAQYRSITNIIVGINVVVFILNYVFGYLPMQYIFGGSLLSIWTWITIVLAGFTHLSFFHIFFNMSFLMSLGPVLEKRLGKVRFVSLYVFSLLVSGVFVVLLASNPTAGASGALYGLFAYFVCVTLRYGTDKQEIRNVLTTFGINIAFTLLMPGISIMGHLGGIVAGIIGFLIYDRK